MLTKRQKQILDFIKHFSQKNNISPTIDEIRKHFRLKSVATVHQHLEALKTKGYLDRSKNKTRSTSVSSGNEVNKLIARSNRSGFYLVPLLGSANAGEATLFAEENITGYMKVPKSILGHKKDIFALQVEGDSMNRAKINGENIEDGDFVLIDSNYISPENGDYVLSVIGGCANLKKFRKNQKTGLVTLLSESTNPKHNPITISPNDDFIINGKIVAVRKS